MINSRRIGIVCAMPFECEGLVSKLKRLVPEEYAGVRFYGGSSADRKVVLAVSGIGKANAAHGTTLLIERYHPTCLIHIGIGGCYPDTGIGVGDIAVAEKEIYADEGVVGRTGFRDLREIGLPLYRDGRRKFFNEFPASAPLLRHFRKVAARSVHSVSYGTFLTVSTVTGTLRKARELRDSFGGICESMEGAAVYHMCAIHAVPCLEIRGISNVVEDRDRSSWDLESAAKAAQRIAWEFAETL